MKDNPQMYPKLLRHIVNCHEEIAKHHRDYHDMLRMLYTKELLGIDASKHIKETLYAYGQITKELHKLESIVLYYQKNGDKDE